jgi:two-component system chemotaxis response regulator CheB
MWWVVPLIHLMQEIRSNYYGMNGLAFLRNLMRLRPMPVVMVSTVTSKGASVALKALELGAFDYIAKPNNNGDTALYIF